VLHIFTICAHHEIQRFLNSSHFFASAAVYYTAAGAVRIIKLFGALPSSVLSSSVVIFASTTILYSSMHRLIIHRYTVSCPNVW
jgi:hypothetical protein